MANGKATPDYADIGTMPRKNFRLVVRLGFNWMVELLPIIVFWIAFQRAGLMVGIAWSLLATVTALALAMLVQRRWAVFPVVMTGFFLLFGGYSLLARSPTAFIFQHTLYYGFGGLLLALGARRGKSLLKPLFDNLFEVTERGWLILARRWSVLFFLLALGNEVIWRTMTETTWAAYKVAMAVIITAFGLWQLRVTRRERLPTASPWGFKIR